MPKRGLGDLPRLVADLLRFKSDAIVCFGPTAAMALKSAGGDIPIVFVVVCQLREICRVLPLVINPKTAQALGLTIQQSLLLRADEVIQ